jgi:uncharacterized protein YndB with AHSA1/START domain
MIGLAHHHTLYIRCRLAELWAALTEAEQTRHWFLGTAVESSFEVGAAIRYLAHVDGDDDARVDAIRGIVRAVEPNHRLVYEFRFCDLDEPATELTWTLAEAAQATGVVRLDIDHRGFVAGSESWKRTSAGWPVIVSSLKTWLETSTPLEITGA